MERKMLEWKQIPQCQMMLQFFGVRQPGRSLFCVLFAVVLVVTLLIPVASGKVKPKPRAQEWQIRGIEAALEDDRPGVKQLALSKLTTYDPREVRLLLKPDTAQKIGNLFRDDKQDSSVRGRAAAALGNFGDAAKPLIPEILNILKDSNQDSSVRRSAAVALGNLGNLRLGEIAPILNPAYEELAEVDYLRFTAYFSSGGDDNIKRLLKWIAKSKQLPEKLERDEGVKTLEVFKQAWVASKDLPELRSDLESKIAMVATARKITWKTEDLPLLQQHYKNLKDSGSSNADSVQAAITALEAWQWATNLWTTLLAHATFWLALIFLYPKSPAIQAIFF
jgi:HEAT repeat protein